MSLNIISNFAANVAHRLLVKSDKEVTSSLAKLAAGTRVLSAKDDAASLAVGNRLAAEVAGLRRAGVNASQAISMVQVADGAQANINDMLIRMKSLSVQSASAQLSDNERGMIDTEFQKLLLEIDRIADDTDFTGQKLVNGDVSIPTIGVFTLAAGVVNVTFQGDSSKPGTATNQDSVSIGAVYDSGSNSFTTTVHDTAGVAQETFTGLLDSNFFDGSGVGNGTTMTTGALVTLASTTADSDNEMQIALNTDFVVDDTNGDYVAATSANIDTTVNNNITELTFKVGTGAIIIEDDLTVEIHGISTVALGLTGVDLRTLDNSNLASQVVSEAIDDLQNFRAGVGANQNRLEFAAANLATVTENTESARSSMLDLDVAAEMSVFVSKQILVQSGVSMLSQANQLPQNLLRLFQ